MPVAKRVLLLFVLCLVPLLAPAQTPKPLVSDREKIGYMIGMDVGKSLDAAKADIDLTAFEQAMRGSLAGNPPKLDETRARSVALAVMQRMQARGASPAAKLSAADRVVAGQLAGLDVGGKLAGIRDEFDVASMVRGLRAAWGDGKALLDDAQIAAVRQALANRLQQRAAEAGERNAVEGARFLESNRSVKGVVTTRSGLQYQVLRQGAGARPLPSARVRVNYEGRLLDGKVFDSSYQRGQPAEFALNAVIPGWTEGLALMPVGAKYRFWIPGAIAYGKRGAPPDIGPNQTLVFDVELMDILK